MPGTIYMAPLLSYYRSRQHTGMKDGIQRVVEALHEHMPAFGWRFVESPMGADLISSHAGALPEQLTCDVAHCHGLYPTYDWVTGGAYFGLNARVIRDLRHARGACVPSPWVAEILQRDMHMAPMVIGHGLNVKNWPEPDWTKARPQVVLWDKNRSKDVCDVDPLVELALRRPGVRFLSTFGGERQPANLELLGLMPFDRLKELRHTCAVYLATTKETWGIATLESMISGMPVVGYDWGGTGDLVVHGETGFLATPGDINGLMEGLDFCLKNRQALGRNAYQQALAYDWLAVMPSYDKLYCEALEKKRGSSPRVSVVIPCYNYEDWVTVAMKSVLNQSFQDWECLVVNDGSTDGSLRVAREFAEKDSRFRVIDKANEGVAATRNRGACESKGNYLCFLDADDAIAPSFLAVLVKALGRDPSLGIVYTGLSIGGKRRNWPTRCQPELQFRGKCQVPTCCLVRREAFEGAGGFRQRLAPAEDAELWTKIMSYGWGVEQVDRRGLFLYNIHGGSATSSIREKRKVEPKWNSWLPWTSDPGLMPLAAIVKPRRHSHAVRFYDLPEVSVLALAPDGEIEPLQDLLDSVVAQGIWEWEVIVGGPEDLAERGCPKFSTSYPFVKWTGPSWNLCTKIARARLLVLVESGSYLMPTALRLLCEAHNETGSGFICPDWLDPSLEPHLLPGWDVEEWLRKPMGALLSVWKVELEVAAQGRELTSLFDVQQALIHAGIYGSRCPHQILVNQGGQAGKEEQEEVLIRWANVQIQARQVKRQGLQKLAVAPVGEMVLEFTERRQGKVLFTAPSGKRYKFDSGANRRQPVRQEDVRFLMKTQRFRIVRR